MRAGELPLWPSSLAAVTGARSPAGSGSGGGMLGGVDSLGVGGVGAGVKAGDSGAELCAAVSAAQKLLPWSGGLARQRLG